MHILKNYVFPMLLCSILGTSCQCQVKSNSLSAADMKTAVDILINSKAVMTNQIGESGKFSEYSLAFSKLFEKPNSKEIFLNIFKDSKTINGKIYALIALYYFDKKAYGKLKKEFNGTEKVSTFWYCEKAQYPIDEIFKEIEKKDLLRRVLITAVREQEVLDKDKD